MSKNSPNLRRGGNILLLLIILTQLSLLIPFLIFIPLVDTFLSFKCLNFNNVLKIMLGNCESNLFRFIIPLSKLPTLCTAFIISAMTVPIAFVTFKETIDTWIDFLKTLSYNNNENCMFGYWTIVLNYRRIQIFMILFNECFQTTFWPVLEFIGSMLCICLGYSFVVYSHLFGNLFKLAMTSVLILLLCVIVFVMDVGSRSLCSSFKSIRQMKLLLKQNDPTWFRNFVKSCSPVALKIGCFHKMDRSRGPHLVPFILQRTFFLVLKSRDSFADKI